MSNSLLFGYSVEEGDGKFVITLSGKLAVPIMQDIAANTGPAGSSATGKPMMFPYSMFPYSLLASQAVRMTPEDRGEDEEQGDTALADIFAQGFDKDLEEFDRHLGRYQAMLSPTQSNGNGHVTQFTTNESDDSTKVKRTVSKN